MSVLDQLAGISKALLAALIAAATALLAIMSAANESFGQVTGSQWVQVALAGMIALAGVYAVPMKSPPSE